MKDDFDDDDEKDEPEEFDPTARPAQFLTDAELKPGDIATPSEIRAYWTATMRNDQRWHKRRVSAAKRLKASELLARAYGLFDDRLAIEGKGGFDLAGLLAKIDDRRKEGAE